ncbi:hypothetical protein LX16_3271 [Stackebrandtia albiflava]|uniref:DUF4878 domain-containing protein n=1 Tax=Stackebrandtia albiflava TaxID=406432 RepID=A0A562V3V8_9ACTN|nr:hypothetical protein [Stackebrandtia albiflava]TWJ12512.1 hypothetical protein LX16_3271 [Stackebrandtia albiflava]
MPLSPRRTRIRRRLFVTVVAVPVLAAATALVVAWWPTGDPEDVVTGYLDAIRSGDFAATAEYTAQAPGEPDTSDELLTEAAMPTGWEFDDVRTVGEPFEDSATVDFTVAADGRERDGRFRLDLVDGEWVIADPYVTVDASRSPMGYVEFNGVTVEADRVRVFPGVYRVFESDRELFDLPDYIAVPGGGTGYRPSVPVTDALTGLVETRVTEWIDSCVAAATDPFPDGCPFRADWGGGEYVFTNGHIYDDPTGTWRVAEYPKVWVSQDLQGFRLRQVAPGEVVFTGTGMRGDALGDIALDCRFAVDRLTFRLGPDGEVPLSREIGDTC